MRVPWMVLTLTLVTACEYEGGGPFGSGGEAGEGYYGSGSGSGGGGGSFNGREHPIREEGVSHGRDNRYPFLCRDDNDLGVTCPDDYWPETDKLSCDAAGCHGSYDYSPDTAGSRNLNGSAGPSCYNCHGRTWNTTTTGSGVGSGGGGGEGGGDEDDD
ncbi:MAG: hypothetical protein H6742_03765 [Alphaproteobacteria bacterium]|nr:hypothetical protein [Alphaproteobacteria bacterium]